MEGRFFKCPNSVKLYIPQRTSSLTAIKLILMTDLFRFKVEWLTKGYSHKAKVERDRDSGTLNSEEAKALLGVHKRRYDPPTEPSSQDIQLLKQLYDGMYIVAVIVVHSYVTHFVCSCVCMLSVLFV